MKTFRAIVIGTGIWILGVIAYATSFGIPVLGDQGLQANIFLSLAIPPLVWFGAALYYGRDKNPHGFWVGLVFFLTAAMLDVAITVPFLVIPNGGSHYEFFTDLAFWLIALEFMAVAVAYHYIKKEVKNVKKGGSFKNKEEIWK